MTKGTPRPQRLRILAVLISLYAVGTAAGLIAWDHIRLPFSNPWRVQGPLPAIGMNPNDNYLRFLVLLIMPCLLLFVAYLLKLRPGPLPHSAEPEPVVPVRRSLGAMMIALIVCIAVSASLYIHTESAEGPLDTFHEGESLGLASLVARGQLPYTDFVIGHGPFQDPLRSNLAFSLFGRSVASVRSLQSVLKVVQFALIAVFLALVFAPAYPRALWVLGGFLALHFAGALRLYGIDLGVEELVLPKQRDITLYLFLISMLLLHRALRKDAPSPLTVACAAFASAFVAAGASIYSADRGFYLSAAFVVVAAALYLTYARRTGRRAWYSAGALAGVAAAVIALGWVVQWQLPSFFSYTFGAMPKYWDLLCAHVYPILSPWFLAMALLVAAEVYWLLLQLLRCVYSEGSAGKGFKLFLDRYFIEFVLGLCCVLFFRSPMGRADAPHISAAAGLPCLFALIIIGKHYLPTVVQDRAVRAYRDVAIAVAAAVLLVIAVQATTGGLLRRNFPLGQRDSQLVPKTYAKTADFLGRNLGTGDTFYTLTSEGIWFYLVRTKCPTRFPLLFFAAPDFYQREVVRDLERNKTKYILVSNDHWANAIDGFTAERRFPIVMDYVRRNYVPCRRFGSNVIVIRRTAVREQP